LSWEWDQSGVSSIDDDGAGSDVEREIVIEAVHSVSVGFVDDSPGDIDQLTSGEGQGGSGTDSPSCSRSSIWNTYRIK
jgi:hypothetical protein